MRKVIFETGRGYCFPISLHEWTHALWSPSWGGLGWAGLNRHLLPSQLLAPLFPGAPKEQAGTTELITTIQA